MTLIRITWKSKATDACGHGQWFEKGRYGVENMVGPLNRNYPELDHKLEYWTRRMN